MGVRALTFTGKALDGPVLAALQQGMKVLKYPKERAKELVNGIPADFRIARMRFEMSCVQFLDTFFKTYLEDMGAELPYMYTYVIYTFNPIRI